MIARMLIKIEYHIPKINAPTTALILVFHWIINKQISL
jgi:hypothetical protein